MSPKLQRRPHNRYNPVLIDKLKTSLYLALKSVKTLIGNTPVIHLKTANKHVRLFAKCEFLNPTASIKDRVAKYIIEKARKSGDLKPAQLIVEASSGNMGTSVAAVAREYGHPVHITCPEKTGKIKRRMIETFGATLTVCRTTTDTQSGDFYVNRAKAIAAEKNGFLINQYDNLLNPECHYMTTGKEIVEYCIQHRLNLDYFIHVGGSGGTVSGCARRIKAHFPLAKVIMPDPVGSVYYDLKHQGAIIPDNVRSYCVEGPGNPVYCRSMDLNCIDTIIQFNDQDALDACDRLARNFGLLVGHSSGANFYIAQKLISQLQTSTDKTVNIMMLLPDSGIKYLSAG